MGVVWGTNNSVVGKLVKTTNIWDKRTNGVRKVEDSKDPRCHPYCRLYITALVM